MTMFQPLTGGRGQGVGGQSITRNLAVALACPRPRLRYLAIQARDDYTSREDYVLRQPLPEVDLAVAPLPSELFPRYQSASFSEFIPEASVVPLGGEIIYLGVFAPLGIPMAPAGILGTQEVPIKQPGYEYKGDLVDCRSYGGFSGSPCFSLMNFATDDPPRIGDKERPRRSDGSVIGLNPISTLSLFCGIFTAHFSDREPADGVVSRYGVGVMLPSEYVREALMTDDARNERRKWDKARQAQIRGELPPLQNADASDTSEFDQFEVLTKQLVNTPKPSKE
jgi:hypothetical protein